MNREEEYVLLLNVMEKIRRRVYKIKREDGAYDKTAEDIRKILMELDIDEIKPNW